MEAMLNAERDDCFIGRTDVLLECLMFMLVFVITCILLTQYYFNDAHLNSCRGIKVCDMEVISKSNINCWPTAVLSRTYILYVM